MTKKTMRDLYKFPGFRARATLKPHPEDEEGYIVTLDRRQKKPFCSGCGTITSGYRDRRTHIVRDLDAGANRIYLEFEYRRVACPHCNAVKRTRHFPCWPSRPGSPNDSKTVLANSAAR